jgi:hypothetical protein
MDWEVPYGIGKLLECRFPKWARIIHLDTWNTSYGLWLPTTRSQKLPWFSCVKVACDILLKSSQRGLQLFFWLHFNRKFEHKVMGPQKVQESQFWEFQDSHLGVPGQNAIWMWASWRGIEYTIRGKVVASPKSGPWWVLWVWVCPWLVVASKVFKLCTN